MVERDLTEYDPTTYLEVLAELLSDLPEDGQEELMASIPRSK